MLSTWMFVAILSLASPALGQDDNAEGLYLGAGLGDFSADIDELSDVDDVDLDFDSNPVFSTGLGFTVAERVNLRLEYEVVDIDKFDDAHAVWLNTAWRF